MGKLRYIGRYKRKLHNLQLALPIEPDEYIWWDLGQIQIGVSNAEGYSKEFISIGTKMEDFGTNTNIDIVRFTEKFYYSNSQSPHHIDEQYLRWNGNLVEYIDKKRRRLWKEEV